jgi:hypothetical protein
MRKTEVSQRHDDMVETRSDDSALLYRHMGQLR